MSTLYELTQEYQALLDMMEDCDDAQVVIDTLEGIEGEIEIKADGYAKVMRQLEGEADAIKAEIDRLSSRKKTIENNIAKMKESLQAAMVATGKTKFKTDLFSFAVQKNGGKAPVVWHIPADELPDKFVKIERKPDSAAMFDYIELTGDTRYAHLGERGESLRIK